MPVIEVKLYDRRVTEESVPKMIEALTQALHESSGAAVKHIQVIIQGVPPQHWAKAGSRAPDGSDPAGQAVAVTRCARARARARPAPRPRRPPASHGRGEASCAR